MGRRARDRVWWGVALLALVATMGLTALVHAAWFVGVCAVVAVMIRRVTSRFVGVEDDPGYGPEDRTRRTTIIPPGLWPPP